MYCVKQWSHLGETAPGILGWRLKAAWRLLCAGAVVAAFGTGGALAQESLRLKAITVGQRPQGVDTAFYRRPGGFSPVYVVVANSGDDSISLLELQRDATGLASLFAREVVRGIPSPYAVATCRDKVLVTSPADDLVSVLYLETRTVSGTIQLGPEPYAAACVSHFGEIGVVSSLGDNSLWAFDVNSLAVLARVPDVPGSRGPSGVALTETEAGRLIAFVAGTDADIVTLVDLTASKVLTRVPIRRPPAVSEGYPRIFVASAAENSIILLNVETLQIELTIPNIPNPQDFIFSTVGTIAALGSLNSIARITENGNSVAIIPGIPGAPDWPQPQ